MKELKERIVEFWVNKAHQKNLSVCDYHLTQNLKKMMEDYKANTTDLYPEYKEVIFKEDITKEVWLYLIWNEYLQTRLEVIMWDDILPAALCYFGLEIFFSDIKKAYMKAKYILTNKDDKIIYYTSSIEDMFSFLEKNCIWGPGRKYYHKDYGELIVASGEFWQKRG